MQLLEEKQTEKTMTFLADIKCKVPYQKRPFKNSLIIVSIFSNSFKAGRSSIAFPGYLMGTMTVDSRLVVPYDYIG